MKKIQFFTYTIFLIYPIFAQGQELGEDIAKSVWKEMISFQPKIEISSKISFVSEIYPIDNDLIDDSMYDYWKEISDECQRSFLEGLGKAKKSNQIDSFAKEYVSFFGKADTSADMRWVLGCPILATRSYLLLTIENQQIDFLDEFKKFAVSYNKYIVNNSISSKTFYKRIHWFTLWAAERPFTHGNKIPYSDDLLQYTEQMSQMVKEKKWNENNYEYWYQVRYFLSLIYLCHLEDQVIDFHRPLTPKILIEINEKLSNSFILMTTHKIYDPDKSQYVIVPSLRLPPFELPTFPFPEIKDSLINESSLVFPRISRKILGVFNEDFLGKIIERRSSVE